MGLISVHWEGPVTHWELTWMANRGKAQHDDLLLLHCYFSESKSNFKVVDKRNYWIVVVLIKAWSDVLNTSAGTKCVARHRAVGVLVLSIFAQKSPVYLVPSGRGILGMTEEGFGWESAHDCHNPELLSKLQSWPGTWILLAQCNWAVICLKKGLEINFFKCGCRATVSTGVFTIESCL